MSAPLKRRIARLEPQEPSDELTVIGFVPEPWAREEAEDALLELARDEGVEPPASVIPLPDDRRLDAALHWIGDVRTLLSEIARSRRRIGVGPDEPIAPQNENPSAPEEAET